MIGWGIDMERDSNVVMGGVSDFVEADGVVDVGDAIGCMVMRDGDYGRWRVDGFFQLSLEKKHIAPIVGMIMDHGLLVGIPCNDNDLKVIVFKDFLAMVVVGVDSNIREPIIGGGHVGNKGFLGLVKPVSGDLVNELVHTLFIYIFLDFSFKKI